MPTDHGFWSHHEQRYSPIRQDLRDPDPETAVHPSQPWAWTLSLHHRQLLPEDEILQSQFLKARRENQKTKDREQEPEHANEYRVQSGRKSILLSQM